MIPAAFDLAGQVAVVTGAGSPDGIGFATAALLGELGAAVVLGGTSERVHQRAGELREQGVQAEAVIGDLTDPDTAARTVAAAMRQWNRLDILVNNAGMISVAEPDFQAGTLLETDVVSWQSSLRRNLDTAFHMTRAALAVMRGRGYGRVVMVSSVTGPVMAMRADVAYASAKAGIVGFARALAVDHGSEGITVNAVAPGWIATGSQTESESADGRHTPLGRSGRAEEVAAAIAWLASPGAAYVTGQCLVVDGGNSVAEQRAT
ncbi:SDR family oxidoreductase [Jatrophihabitans telluris]|uniref:SDR family oxidoreductase n=1 Tax=Jatrophihabitans telluris TaxID=2038343 RepID=A0ABY4R1W3_9ACTN|nr:SDR family NAD(P)-dependent oxidoreductase [Jatrophihabitans telluris]UQX89906.1 SDR family oxidoreductase [Jatrophihabitans telluris]